MIKYTDTLKDTTLFKNMEKEDIERIIKLCAGSVAKFKKNDPVFMMADNINKISVILSGSVKVHTMDENGLAVTVDILKAKDIFGEAYSYLNIKEIPVSVSANEDSEILFLDNIKILSAGRGIDTPEFQITYNLVHNMAQKLFNLNQKLFMLQKVTIREKLTVYFKQQRKISVSNILNLPMNKTQLAEYLGVNRTSLSRELSNMINEGLIEMNKNIIKILF